MQRHTDASPTTERRRSKARILSRMADVVQLPGMVNAHCHAFQRLLRGRTEGRDFWAWRDTMLDLAAQASVDETYGWIYRALRYARYTAVGQFPYLGVESADEAGVAARRPGVKLLLLYVAYARGGVDRFRQESV